MDWKQKLNLNNYELWRNHRRLVTLGIFLALSSGYVRAPSEKDFKVKNTCGLLSADLITGKKASKALGLGKTRIETAIGDTTKITNHYYHSKYYCQGYIKGNVGLGY